MHVDEAGGIWLPYSSTKCQIHRLDTNSSSAADSSVASLAVHTPFRVGHYTLFWQGQELFIYQEGFLFVSSDAGITWRKIFQGPSLAGHPALRGSRFVFPMYMHSLHLADLDDGGRGDKVLTLHSGFFDLFSVGESAVYIVTRNVFNSTVRKYM